MLKTINIKNFIKNNYILLIFLLFYTFISIIVSVERYWQFSSFYLDLGLFDQAIWRLAHFQVPVIDHISKSIEGKIIFADHFNPSMLLFAPLYWFTERTETLLITQSIFVSLSAFVLHKISSVIIKSHIVRVALLVSYLGFIGLQNALITDFHDTTVLTLPLSLFFWSILKKKWKLYWILLLLILGFKETMAGLGFGLGFYVFLTGYKKIGFYTMIVSILWAIIASKCIIPYFSGGVYIYTPQWPVSISAGIESFFFPIIKTKTMLYGLASFGFLPIAYLPLIPTIVENYIERFVFNNAAIRWDLGMHYNAPLAPLFFMSAVECIKKFNLEKKIPKLLSIWAVATILMVIILNRFILHGPLMLAFNPAFYETTKENLFLDTFINQIPKDGLLMTQQNIAPRFTHYCVIMLKRDYKKYNPDYIALDLRSGQNPANFFPLTEEGTKSLFAELKTDNQYIMKMLSSNTYIFAKRDKKRDNTYCN